MNKKELLGMPENQRPENQRLVEVYRAAYEAVVRVTSNIVARCNKYGVSVALSMLENPTLDEAAKQMHIFASLLEKLDRDGYLNGDDAMMSVRARGYAHAVGEIAGAFGRQDEEEVRRLIQELDRGSLI